MKKKLVLIVTSDGEPFAGLPDKEKSLAYHLAQAHGVSIGIGMDRPLEVSHCIADSTLTETTIAEMEKWLAEVIAACKEHSKLAGKFSVPVR